MQLFHGFTCPLDGLLLKQNGKSWYCPSGHCFDQARQGQLNLLPVQYKKSRDPGDSKEMVEARAHFLAEGFYLPLAQQLSQELTQLSPDVILDAGCGEGYYQRTIEKLLPEGFDPQFLGIDISKWAIKKAANQSRHVSWAVASNAHLPIQSKSVDAILCLFGFPVYEEFQRVLRPGGIIVQVDPGIHHLQELRQRLYSKQKLSAGAPTDKTFSILRSTNLQYGIQLTSNISICNLLSMTPHLHKAPKDNVNEVKAMDALKLNIDMSIKVLQAVY